MKTYIANWKMYLTYEEEINWIKNNLEELEKIGKKNNVIICFSYLLLDYMSGFFDDGLVGIAAQNCATKNTGQFIGEISPLSLHQAGCEYCLIGHSERRINYNETDEIIAEKALNLLKSDIIPILCIGETKEQNEANETKAIITSQLKTILDKLKKGLIIEKKLILAYEPVWSIGTGVLPTNKQIEEVFNEIRKIIKKHSPDLEYQLVYGGSVNSANAKELKQIKGLDGFLIGKASTNFEEFKKIILS